MSRTIGMDILALRGLVVLPGERKFFDIGRKKSIMSVKSSMKNDSIIFLVCQMNPEEENISADNLYDYGIIAKILQVSEAGKGVLRVAVEGISIGNITNVTDDNEGLRGEVIKIEEEDDIVDENVREGYRRQIFDVVDEYIKYHNSLDASSFLKLKKIKDISSLIWTILQEFNMHYTIAQALIEEPKLSERVINFCNIMLTEIDVIKTKLKLQIKLKRHIDKNQRDYIYREQIRMLRKELGDQKDDEEASDEYKKRLEKLDAPVEVKEKIQKEIKRFRSISSSSEEGVLETYIETMLSLPWNKTTKEQKNIVKAEKILEEDHYGMKKIKQRILEYLAARFYSNAKDAPILCLVGPPGTGKTSIAKSIARALNVKYERICLGGVKDEAEIRGHRKTYIGAMPGRIASALQHAGTSNPLILLDEIDKMGVDQRNNISSAMLEVLDSAQNSTFRDHYLEVPMDLSRVFFIATANSVETIPGPLLDRMEVIEVSGYTEYEKFHILKKYLLPKQLQNYGLKKNSISINKAVILSMIEDYTREAGVRKLEQMVKEIIRKIIWEETKEQRSKEEFEKRKIEKDDLKKYLGKPKYENEKLEKKNEIGVVRGLAWTKVGGDTLEIEALVLPGQGKLHLTGNLGDVMKESAQIAYTYVQAIAPKYQLKKDFFEKHDICIHVPEGAVPKDGPSAGITMTTAVLSAVTAIPVKSDVAMTGEMTLTGRVFPIGGLREKMVAAKAFGITHLIVPKRNEKDVLEIDDEIKKGLSISYVEKYEEVAEIALEK